MEISVNGVRIPEHSVFAEMQYHPAPDRSQAQTQAATALVIRELLCQEARRCGIDASPEPVPESEEPLIDALLEQALAVPDPETSECRRYYEGNRTRFLSPPLFEASHILIVPPPDEPADHALDMARAQAERLIGILQREPARFPELAATHSACPSRERGGSMGQIRPGDTVPEFETALVSMAPGEISAVPVASRYGFHIIRLDHRVDGEPLPFEHVLPQIEAYLRETAYRRAAMRYLTALIDAADIQGIESLETRLESVANLI